MKDFKEDFFKFKNKIDNNINFSLVRFGDGELMLIEKENLNLMKKGVGEFKYDNSEIIYEKSRQLLEYSLKFKSDEYYVGIGCRCCIGDDKFNYIKSLSKQNEENLTWANIFVNSNYNLFKTKFIKSLNNRKVYLVCHEKSDTSNIPFSLEKTYKIKSNGWVENLDIIDIIKNDISDNNIKDSIFLFCAGPLSNILVYKLHMFNKKNTYIDLGSVLDGYLKLPCTRQYLLGGSTLKKTCIW